MLEGELDAETDIRTEDIWNQILTGTNDLRSGTQQQSEEADAERPLITPVDPAEAARMSLGRALVQHFFTDRDRHHDRQFVNRIWWNSN